jgi:hypothetical protein
MQKILQKQLKLIKNIAEDAQQKQIHQISQDPEILGAIYIVEEFLRKKKRICYGGQAINAHLPKKYQFYKDIDLPDYDFFTPTPDQDIDELVEMFTEKGYKEIGIRLSVHEGTTKLYINFLPMADITGIDDAVYKRLFARAIPYKGIYNSDPDFLRMMMYLELSRPAGEVGRWEKVYERLFLLNTLQPIKTCKWRSDKRPALMQNMKENLLQMIISRGNILAGLDVYSNYKVRRGKRKTLKWFVRHWPLIIYSESPKKDSDFFIDYLTKIGLITQSLTVTNINAVGEIVPACSIIKYEEIPILLFVKETACHSYITINLVGNKELKIASIDTLITLFMSFMFHAELEEIVVRPLICLIHEIILFSMKAREQGTMIPFLSITCSGHQKQIATLLRERAGRVGQLRNTQKKIKKFNANSEIVKKLTMKNK